MFRACDEHQPIMSPDFPFERAYDIATECHDCETDERDTQ